MTIAQPTTLASHHEVESFSSGIENLDHWLKRRALKNQVSGASRTFVACENQKVGAYYALASSAVAVAEASGRFARNMPNPVPVVVLGRLAVDQNFQGKGMGRALVRDAGYRVLQAADTIGIRCLIVHAISTEARNFYLQLGFELSPLDPLMLMITLANLKAAG